MAAGFSTCTVCGSTVEAWKLLHIASHPELRDIRQHGVSAPLRFEASDLIECNGLLIAIDFEGSPSPDVACPHCLGLQQGDAGACRPGRQSLAELRSSAYDAGAEIEDPEESQRDYLREWDKRCELALLVMRLLRSGHFRAAESLLGRSSNLLDDLRMSQTEREQHDGMLRVLQSFSRFDPHEIAKTVDDIQSVLKILRNRRDLVKMDLDAWLAFKSGRKLLRERVAENAKTLSSVRWQRNLTAIDRALQHQLAAVVADPRHPRANRVKAAQELTCRFWATELPEAMRASASRVLWVHALQSLERSYESFVIRGSPHSLKESIEAWQDLEADYSIAALPTDLAERRAEVLKKIGQLEQSLRQAIEAFVRSVRLVEHSRTVASFADAKVLLKELRQIEDLCSSMMIEPSKALLDNLESAKHTLVRFRRRRRLRIALLAVVALGVVGLIVARLVGV